MHITRLVHNDDDRDAHVLQLSVYVTKRLIGSIKGPLPGRNVLYNISCPGFVAFGAPPLHRS